MCSCGVSSRTQLPVDVVEVDKGKAFTRDDVLPKVVTLDLLAEELTGVTGEAAAVDNESGVVRRNRERRNRSSDARRTRVYYFIAHEVAEFVEPVEEKDLSKVLDIIESVSFDMFVRYVEAEINQNDFNFIDHVEVGTESLLDASQRRGIQVVDHSKIVEEGCGLAVTDLLRGEVEEAANGAEIIEAAKVPEGLD